MVDVPSNQKNFRVEMRGRYGQIDVSASLHHRMKQGVPYGRLRIAVTKAAEEYLDLVQPAKQ
jgi:hypothetical protein